MRCTCTGCSSYTDAEHKGKTIFVEDVKNKPDRRVTRTHVTPGTCCMATPTTYKSKQLLTQLMGDSEAPHLSIMGYGREIYGKHCAEIYGNELYANGAAKFDANDAQVWHK